MCLDKRFRVSIFIGRYNGQRFQYIMHKQFLKAR